MWKQIDGYFWPYRINEDGNVERQVGPDEWVRLNPFVKRDKGHEYGRLCVRMKRADGKMRNVFVKALMIDAFFGGPKPGVYFCFRNNMTIDCSLYNLVPMSREASGRRTGGGNRRSIEKVDKYGHVVELYSSVSEAARKNYISRKSIWMRCKKKVRNPYLLDGYTYRYEVSK